MTSVVKTVSVVCCDFFACVVSFCVCVVSFFFACVVRFLFALSFLFALRLFCLRFGRLLLVL